MNHVTERQRLLTKTLVEDQIMKLRYMQARMTMGELGFNLRVEAEIKQDIEDYKEILRTLKS